MAERDQPETVAILHRIEQLICAMGKAALAEVIAINLADPKHRKLYDQAGKTPVRTLSKRTGFSVGKISNMWQKWEQAGLMVKEGKYYKKLF